MDNFRRHKRPQQRPHSIDGFVRGSSRPEGAGFQFQRHSSYKPANQPEGLSRTNRYFAGDNQRNPGKPITGSDNGLSGSIKLDLPNEAKKRRKSKKHPGLRVALKFMVILLVTGTVASGYLFGKGYLKARQIFKGGGSAAALEENVDPAKLNGEGDGRVNILILGRGGPGHTGPDLTDTILIASIDPSQHEAALLSLPRDLWVKPAGHGYMKINSVFAAGKSQGMNDKLGIINAEEKGLKLLESTISGVIGIPINYHAIVDFEGFKKAINTVGGIDIDVKEKVYEVMRLENKQYVLDVKTGNQHFDGLRALAYARCRHCSPRSDFDRNLRQREVLVGTKNKIFTVGTFANPIKINELLSAFGDHIRSNLKLEEILRLYEIGQQIDSSKIESIGLADPPNNYITTQSINGLSTVVPRAGVGNYKEIQNFIRNKLKDGFLLKENATVMVLNGTNVTGLAARTADELKSYGYNVSKVADSPIKNQQSTIVVDMRSGQKKYTKAYLEKRFGIKVSSTIPDNRIVPGEADFVIILGQNEENRLDN